MNDKFKVFIVEDEQNNLDLLKHFIDKFCLNLNVIGEAKDINTSIELIEELKPEILFLDIQLNDGKSFEILDKIDFSEMEVIFITAYQEYALKAFKYNAVDYILKPLSIEELILSVNKAIIRIQERKLFEREYSKYRKGTSNNNNDFITVSSLDKTTLLKKTEILFCKSDGRYTTFYLKDTNEVVACKNLGEYEDILNDSFFRIHHSYIVNLDYVKNINKKAGNYCEMSNGAMLPIAKRRQEGLNRFLKIKE